MKNFVKRISGGWIFLILILIIYGAVSLTNLALASATLFIFWNLLQKIAPILIFVFVLIFLCNLFLKPKIVTKYLSKESGIKGWLLAIGGGIVSMGAIYMWYPLLAELKEKGVSNALIATFLYNRAIKLQLLPFLIYYFGWLFTIILTVYMIIFSIVNGWLVEKLTTPTK